MKLNNDCTIAAIATGQAAGGIGVVRISGPEAHAVADRVFKAADGVPLTRSAGYQAHFGHVSCDGWQDEAVALVFRAPHSYTGEDVVELSCHGGLYNTRMTLRACLEAGAENAERGEFTRRAYENGKLSLTQAEAVMAVIAAQGRQAEAAAQRAQEGRLSAVIGERIEALQGIAARIAAWCDFPDEDDVPEVSVDGIIAALEQERDNLETLVKSGDVYALSNGIDTVICGRPNVGKSTLMNLLSGCERSIVTDIPGTTRDVVEQQVTLGDCILRLSDTAGLHDTDDIIEAIGVERTQKRIENAALVIAVFDGSEPLCEDDRRLIDLLEKRSCPCIAVVNKNDLEQKLDTAQLERCFGSCIYLSAAQGNGLAELEGAVMQVTELEKLDAASAVLVTERQLQCARRAYDCIKSAAEDARFTTLDAVNILVFEGIDHLMELTGGSVTESVIDEIFSKFCIGK
ncbi:MAG: tRNA uridine-5-carboxymethylaminomethyl(34) synthesis GTPase MnmE [Ruminococcaceae bacterium]|nr:tRNA uridine-5-carboxymethylaminomethyl(34) synthesis GTPase MnmE [Oscillospiraceae bacterium]